MSERFQGKGARRGEWASILSFHMHALLVLLAGRKLNILWEKVFNEGNR
jgi:hypothetical protein